MNNYLKKSIAGRTSILKSSLGAGGSSASSGTGAPVLTVSAGVVLTEEEVSPDPALLETAAAAGASFEEDIRAGR